MKPLYIFDIDGTLSLPDHRRHLVEAGPCLNCLGTGSIPHPYFSSGAVCADCKGNGKDHTFQPQWDAFYDACDGDAVNVPVAETLARLADSGAEIWFFTGRTERVRQITEDWLGMNLELPGYELDSNQVVMRKDGDWRADDIVKAEMLAAMLPEDRERLVAVFDDRARVVAMWRKHGVPCFQVAEGNF